ncbi:MAG: nitroreductase family protein [Oscillospiraceae bacterium]|nr:nitroreductase family protein [Oscillospiraceae bacterium]MBQ6492754.1 nitroreductase family protein [Erysipelotrichaceae bacterium]
MKEIYHRTSIRKYQDRKVEKDKIMAILKAAMQAPSAGDQQPWEFYVISDKDILRQLGDVTRYSGCVKDAPVAIVPVYRQELWAPEYAQIDMSIAMENLWLETDSQGLGGVWLGIAPNKDRMKEVERIVGIPAPLRAFAIFALGYPAEERVQEDRFEESRIHFID